MARERRIGITPRQSQIVFDLSCQATLASAVYLLVAFVEDIQIFHIRKILTTSFIIVMKAGNAIGFPFKGTGSFCPKVPLIFIICIFFKKHIDK